MLGVGPSRVDRHLVRPPRALHRQPVHELGPGPALGGLQHDGGPGRPGLVTARPRPPLDLADLGDHRVHGRGELLVHQLGVIALDGVHLVPVAAQQRLELGVRDPGQHRRVGDLVPVQVQDGQHRAVGSRVEELVGVPAARQRAGLGFPVADDAGHDEVRVVERRPVGVRQRVTQLAAFVDRARRLRCRVRRDAAGEGELPEQPGHARGVLGDRRVQLGVGSLQVGVGHHAGPAVPGPADVDDVQVPVPDHPVEVGVDQVQPRRGAPVTEQPRLDVLRPQRLAQQRVAQQVDLSHRQVVRRPPPGVERLEVATFQVPELGSVTVIHNPFYPERSVVRALWTPRCAPRLFRHPPAWTAGGSALTVPTPQRNLRRKGSCGW